jgi:acetyltransferase-like isoleucine patch superfamily enzyme
MAGVVLNSDAIIGKGCIINTCSSVDHDCNIGNFVHIAVGVHIAGTVNIGDKTWVGIGASVSNNINVCGGCMIGAGAVVVKNIELKGTYVGVPARMVK